MTAKTSETRAAKALREAKALCQIIRHRGYKPRSYSGRGMYGDRCVGVTLDYQSEAMDFAPAMVDDEDIGRVLHPTWDSMGLGVIAYWPSLPWPADERDEDEEDDR